MHCFVPGMFRSLSCGHRDQARRLGITGWCAIFRMAAWSDGVRDGGQLQALKVASAWPAGAHVEDITGPATRGVRQFHRTSLLSRHRCISPSATDVSHGSSRRCRVLDLGAEPVAEAVDRDEIFGAFGSRSILYLKRLTRTSTVGRRKAPAAHHIQQLIAGEDPAGVLDEVRQGSNSPWVAECLALGDIRRWEGHV
jgi:hypothetical protein